MNSFYIMRDEEHWLSKWMLFHPAKNHNMSFLVLWVEMAVDLETRVSTEGPH